MGPLVHTATRSMSIHCVVFHIGNGSSLLDSGFGTREMDDPNGLIGADARCFAGVMIDPADRHPAGCRRGIEPEQVTDIILTHLDNGSRRRTARLP